MHEIARFIVYIFLEFWHFLHLKIYFWSKILRNLTCIEICAKLWNLFVLNFVLKLRDLAQNVFLALIIIHFIISWPKCQNTKNVTSLKTLFLPQFHHFLNLLSSTLLLHLLLLLQPGMHQYQLLDLFYFSLHSTISLLYHLLTICQHLSQFCRYPFVLQFHIVYRWDGCEIFKIGILITLEIFVLHNFFFFLFLSKFVYFLINNY